MALMTLADMQQEVYDNVVDSDPTNRALTADDASLVIRLLNRCYANVRGIEDDRSYLVAPNVSGATFDNALGFITYDVTLIEATYRRILRVQPCTSASNTTPVASPLDHWAPWELTNMQWEDPQILLNDGGTNPTSWATAFSAWRAGSATAPGKFNLGLWRLQADTNARFYALTVLKEVTALSATTDKPDLTEEETHWVNDMASSIAARWLGRSEEMIGQIERRLPDELRASAQIIARDYRNAGADPSAEAV